MRKLAERIMLMKIDTLKANPQLRSRPIEEDFRCRCDG